MTIGIDIRVLGSGSKSGIEEYAENLLSYMIPLGEEAGINFRLFYSSIGNRLKYYDWLYRPNVELTKKRIPNRILFSMNRWLGVPKIDRLLGGVDVFFSPHFFLTSLSTDCKRVVTFHDLSFEHFPEFFSLRKRIWHRFEMKPKWQSRFADKIIAVSESTKNDLINLYGVDPRKIEVIYSGISDIFREMADDEKEKFRHKNNLPEKYILSLGKLEPRKNVVSIIEAFDRLNHHDEFKDLHLVIAGARGWLDGDIFKRHSISPNKSKIIIKNELNDEARVGLYNCAKIFVYPSFFEGFGFPPLEAMACGIPVITSANSSLPEVSGRGVMYIDPSNVEDLVNGIKYLTNDKMLCDILAKNIKDFGSFSWKESAQNTLSYLIK